MRSHWLLLAALLLLAGTAASQPIGEPDKIDLFADWPEDIEEAMEAPIPVTPIYPHGESDLHEGPLLPGSSTLDSVPSFTYAVVNPDGSRGPAGDLEVDPDEPVDLFVYLSADQVDPVAESEQAPVDPALGAAPEVTVEASLHVGDERVSQDEATRTLVSANPPVEEPVTMYALELPLDRSLIAQGEGVHVEFSIHQINEGETLTQPRVKIHTGENYPTGLAIPIDRASQDETLQQGGPLDLDQLEEDPQTVRTVATIALVGSLALAAMAGARMIKQIR